MSWIIGSVVAASSWSEIAAFWKRIWRFYALNLSEDQRKTPTELSQGARDVCTCDIPELLISTIM